MAFSFNHTFHIISLWLSLSLASLPCCFTLLPMHSSTHPPLHRFFFFLSHLHCQFILFCSFLTFLLLSLHHGLHTFLCLLSQTLSVSQQHSLCPTSFSLTPHVHLCHPCFFFFFKHFIVPVHPFPSIPTIAFTHISNTLPFPCTHNFNMSYFLLPSLSALSPMTLPPVPPSLVCHEHQHIPISLPSHHHCFHAFLQAPPLSVPRKVTPPPSVSCESSSPASPICAPFQS